MGCNFDKRLKSLIKELEDSKIPKEDIDIAVKKLRDFDKARQEAEKINKYNTDHKNKYELFDGVYSNAEQTDFINKFKEWYSNSFDNNDANNVFVLSGRGGTGKSTSVGKAIEEALGKSIDDVSVMYATPTNKASKILKDALNGKKEVYTVAQLLSMVLKKQPNGAFKLERAVLFNKDTRKMEEVPTKIADSGKEIGELPDNLSNIIVIDEASMLSQDVIDRLIKEAKEYKFKILFMGDNVQLPPVETSSSKALDDESPIFVYPTKNRAELKERMRQGEESPILKVTDLLADQIESGDYSTKVEDKDYKGELEFITSNNEAINNFSEDFKQNPLGTRYIIFNNASNKKYKSLEKSLKDKIYGFNRGQYSKYEQIFFSSPSRDMKGLSGVLKPSALSEKPTDIFSPNTGDEYTVIDEDIKRTTVKTNLSVWTKTVDGKNILLNVPVKFSVNTVTAISNDFINKHDMSINFKAIEEKFQETHVFDKSKVFFNMPVSENKEIKIEELDKSEIAKEGGARGVSVHSVDLNSLDGVIIKNLESDLPKTNSAMLINSHQAQGSTYDTVYTDISNTTNLIKNNIISYKLGTKAMYVATSRPRTKLVMVNAQDITTNEIKDEVIKSEIVKDSLSNTINILNYNTNNPLVNKNARPLDFDAEIDDITTNGNMKTIKFTDFPYKLTVNTDTNIAVVNWGKGTNYFEIPNSKNLKIETIKQETVTKEGEGFVKKIKKNVTLYDKDFIEPDIKFKGISLAIRFNTETNKWYVIEKSTDLSIGKPATNRAKVYKEFKKLISTKTREEILNVINKNAPSANLSTDNNNNNNNNTDNNPSESSDTTKESVTLINEPVIPILTTNSKAPEAKAYAKSIGFSPLSGRFDAHEKAYLRLQQQSNLDKSIYSNSDISFIISKIGDHLKTGELLIPSSEIIDTLNKYEEVLNLYKKLEDKQIKIMGSELGTDFKESQKLDESDFNISEDLENTIGKALDNETLLNDDEFSAEYVDDIKRIASKITDMFKEVLPDYSFRFTRYRSANNEETKGAFSTTLGYSKEDRVQLLVNPNSRLTSESEILLHETVHATLKGIFSKDLRLRNRVKTLRDNFKNDLEKAPDFKTEEEMVTFVMSNMIKGDVSDLYPEMKKRFDYVFSEQSDPEEFMAYMLTNPSMRETGKMLNANNTPIEDNNYSNTIWGKLRKMFSELMKFFNKEASTKDIEVTRAVEDIFDTMLTSRLQYEIRKSKDLEDVVSGYVPIPVLNTVARFGAKGYSKYIESIEKAINSKLSRAAKRNILKEFNKIYYSIKNNKSFKRLINAQKSSNIISNIVKSEVVSSIWNQYFNSNVYSPDKSVRDLMRSFERIDAESRNMRASIFRIVESKLLSNDKKDSRGDYKVTLEKKAKIIKDLVIGSGLNKVFESLSVTDLDRESIYSDLNFLKNDIENFLVDSAPRVIEQLDSLARYGRNRKSNSEIQAINIIGATGEKTFNYLNKSQRDILDRYVITKGLSLMTDAELSSIKSIVGNQDVIHILKIINSTKSEYDGAVNPNGLNEPFFATLNPISVTPRAIHIGTLKEAKSIGSRIVGTEPVFEVDNVKYYKYTTLNYSPSLDAGSINEINSDVDGYRVSNILKKHFSKAKDSNVKQNVDLKISSMKTLLAKKNIKVNHLIPEYSSNGNIVDYIIPFDKNDVYVLQGASISSVEYIANLGFHYKDRTNKITQKDRILIELIKNKVSDEEYKKDKDKYISLGNIDGIRLDNAFYSQFSDVKIPKYLALYLTGARRPSLANMKITLGKYEILDMSKHPNLKNILGISEKFLEEVFSEFKQQLTLFNSGIALGNFSSNMYVAMGDGIDPVTFSKEFTRTSKELYEFEQMITDFEDMRTKVRSGELDSKDSNYNLLFSRIKGSKFFPLYKQGHITPTVDDGEILHSPVVISKLTNKFARKSNIKREIQSEAERLSYKNGNSVEDNLSTARRNIHKRIKVTVPDAIADIKGVLYGDDTSVSKKVAEKILIYGDVAAKMVMLEHRATREDGKFDLDSEIRELGELFINYSHPASGLEQYMEKVTGFLFLKYLFRSLKGYYSLVVKNPMRIGLMTATGALTGIDVSSPDDANFKNGTIEALENRAKGDDLDQVVSQLFSWRISNILDVGLDSVYTTN